MHLLPDLFTVRCSCGVVLYVGFRNTAVFEINQMFSISKKKITPSEVFVYKLHNNAKDYKKSFKGHGSQKSAEHHTFPVKLQKKHIKVDLVLAARICGLRL